MGPTAYTKTSIFRYFYEQYLVLFTMVLRTSSDDSRKISARIAVEKVRFRVSAAHNIRRENMFFIAEKGARGPGKRRKRRR